MKNKLLIAGLMVITGSAYSSGYFPGVPTPAELDQPTILRGVVNQKALLESLRQRLNEGTLTEEGISEAISYATEDTKPYLIEVKEYFNNNNKLAVLEKINAAIKLYE